MTNSGRIECRHCGSLVRANEASKAHGVVGARLCWSCYRHQQRHDTLPPKKDGGQEVSVKVRISKEQSKRLRRLRKDPVIRAVIDATVRVTLGDSFGAAIDRVWKLHAQERGEMDE